MAGEADNAALGLQPSSAALFAFPYDLPQPSLRSCVIYAIEASKEHVPQHAQSSHGVGATAHGENNHRVLAVARAAESLMLKKTKQDSVHFYRVPLGFSLPLPATLSQSVHLLRGYARTVSVVRRLGSNFVAAASVAHTAQPDGDDGSFVDGATIAGSERAAVAINAVHAGTSDAWKDRNTNISAGSIAAVAGNSTAMRFATTQLLTGQAHTAMTTGRPPGHHMGPVSKVRLADTSQGFCLVNSVYQAVMDMYVQSAVNPTPRPGHGFRFLLTVVFRLGAEGVEANKRTSGKHKYHWHAIFGEPLTAESVAQQGAADYFSVIQGPAMDFSTIYQRLASGRYATIGDVIEDVRSIAKNAFKYHTDSSAMGRNPAEYLPAAAALNRILDDVERTQEFPSGSSATGQIWDCTPASTDRPLDMFIFDPDAHFGNGTFNLIRAQAAGMGMVENTLAYPGSQFEPPTRELLAPLSWPSGAFGTNGDGTAAPYNAVATESALYAQYASSQGCENFTDSLSRCGMYFHSSQLGPVPHCDVHGLGSRIWTGIYAEWQKHDLTTGSKGKSFDDMKKLVTNGHANKGTVETFLQQQEDLAAATDAAVEFPFPAQADAAVADRLTTAHGSRWSPGKLLAAAAGVGDSCVSSTVANDAGRQERSARSGAPPPAHVAAQPPITSSTPAHRPVLPGIDVKQMVQRELNSHCAAAGASGAGAGASAGSSSRPAAVAAPPLHISASSIHQAVPGGGWFGAGYGTHDIWSNGLHQGSLAASCYTRSQVQFAGTTNAAAHAGSSSSSSSADLGLAFPPSLAVPPDPQDDFFYTQSLPVYVPWDGTVRGSERKWMIHFEQNVLPAIRAKPRDVIVVSLGFDAFKSDKLGKLSLSIDSFKTIIRKLAYAAPTARIFCVLEGGYGHGSATTVEGLYIDLKKCAQRAMEGLAETSRAYNDVLELLGAQKPFDAFAAAVASSLSSSGAAAAGADDDMDDGAPRPPLTQMEALRLCIESTERLYQAEADRIAREIDASKARAAASAGGQPNADAEQMQVDAQAAGTEDEAAGFEASHSMVQLRRRRSGGAPPGAGLDTGMGVPVGPVGGRKRRPRNDQGDVDDGDATRNKRRRREPDGAAGAGGHNGYGANVDDDTSESDAEGGGDGDSDFSDDDDIASDEDVQEEALLAAARAVEHSQRHMPMLERVRGQVAGVQAVVLKALRLLRRTAASRRSERDAAVAELQTSQGLLAAAAGSTTRLRDEAAAAQGESDEAKGRFQHALGRLAAELGSGIGALCASSGELQAKAQQLVDIARGSRQDATAAASTARQAVTDSQNRRNSLLLAAHGTQDQLANADRHLAAARLERSRHEAMVRSSEEHISACEGVLAAIPALKQLEEVVEEKAHAVTNKSKERDDAVAAESELQARVQSQQASAEKTSELCSVWDAAADTFVTELQERAPRWLKDAINGAPASAPAAAAAAAAAAEGSSSAVSADGAGAGAGAALSSAAPSGGGGPASASSNLPSGDPLHIQQREGLAAVQLQVGIVGSVIALTRRALQRLCDLESAAEVSKQKDQADALQKQQTEMTALRANETAFRQRIVDLEAQIATTLTSLRDAVEKASPDFKKASPDFKIEANVTAQAVQDFAQSQLAHNGDIVNVLQGLRNDAKAAGDKAYLPIPDLLALAKDGEEESARQLAGMADQLHKQRKEEARCALELEQRAMLVKACSDAVQLAQQLEEKQKKIQAAREHLQKTEQKVADCQKEIHEYTEMLNNSSAMVKELRQPIELFESKLNVEATDWLLQAIIGAVEQSNSGDEDDAVDSDGGDEPVPTATNVVRAGGKGRMLAAQPASASTAAGTDAHQAHAAAPAPGRPPLRLRLICKRPSSIRTGELTLSSSPTAGAAGDVAADFEPRAMNGHPAKAGLRDGGDTHRDGSGAGVGAGSSSGSGDVVDLTEDEGKADPSNPAAAAAAVVASASAAGTQAVVAGPQPGAVDDREYEYETFLAYKFVENEVTKERQVCYLMKWKGFDESDNSWVSPDCFPHGDHRPSRYLTAARQSGYRVSSNELQPEEVVKFPWTPSGE